MNEENNKQTQEGSEPKCSSVKAPSPSSELAFSSTRTNFLMRIRRPDLNTALLSPAPFLVPFPKTSDDLTSFFIPVFNRSGQRRGEPYFRPGSGHTANCRGNSCSEVGYNNLVLCAS